MATTAQKIKFLEAMPHSETRARILQRLQARQVRIEQGAQHYAAFDKSDPFALARAKTHIRLGIADIQEGAQGALEEFHYSAEPYPETRSYEFAGERVEYIATAYRNIQRP